MANQNSKAEKGFAPKAPASGRDRNGAGRGRTVPKIPFEPRKPARNANMMQGISNSESGLNQKRYYSTVKSETGNLPRRRTGNYKSGARKKAPAPPLKIAFLGGLNEIGKNMTLYSCGDDMLLVDCGLAFPDSEMLGVDLVIPDFTYVQENADKIKGILITHGHEDHIGGLAYLLENLNIPVYATRLTIGLIEGKLREHKILDKCTLNVIQPGDRVRLGCFEAEFIHVNHSIPDAVAVAIRTPAGLVLQTGDFKIDTTPIDGGVIDLARISRLGEEGILCLLSDSTNAVKPGFTESERKVGETFEVQFHKAGNRRLIVATFASNIHRVQQIIDVAERLGRKVALSGRSLENVVSVAAELGYIRVPEGILVGIDSINRYPPEKMLVITTGSQGEPMSALYRMAFSEHRRVEIGPNDYVIISATPFPATKKWSARWSTSC